jgi:4-amino-4-deoxy-L-arabinose transferase-like glycosyltransferase
MMRKGNLLSWHTFWGVVLVVLVLFLTIYDLEYYPSTWYDEGVHLLVAKKLALEGKYRFGPALGPTVFFPIAAAFRIAGVELLPARVVMVGYLLLCVVAFYVLARYLGGWKFATVGTLLFVSSPGINLLRWGRQVLGEVPAALFFLAGTLLWLTTLEEGRRRGRKGRLLLVGVLLGLAILTKNQFSLLLPGWLLLWVADRLYYRQSDHLGFVLPLLGAVLCVAGWYAGQRLILPAGRHLAAQNVQEWSNALGRGMFTLSKRRMLDAVKFLTDKDTFYAWVVPAQLYAAILSLRRSREGLVWAWLVTLSVLWFGWFTLLSVGWPRYAFLPLTVTAVAVAKVFHDLTEGYVFPIQGLWNKVRSGQWDASLAGRAALTMLLLVTIARSLQGRVTDVIAGGEGTPQQMATYIVEHVPREAAIETYEPEICFLSGCACHFPPGWTMDASIEYVWYEASPPLEYYDFQEYGAPYLLIGDFGRWVHLYDPETVERDYELRVSIGGYELYQAKQGE